VRQKDVKQIKTIMVKTNKCIISIWHIVLCSRSCVGLRNAQIKPMHFSKAMLPGHMVESAVKETNTLVQG